MALTLKSLDTPGLDDKMIGTQTVFLFKEVAGACTGMVFYCILWDYPTSKSGFMSFINLFKGLKKS